jgi:hypothetical protein
VWSGIALDNPGTAYDVAFGSWAVPTAWGNGVDIDNVGDQHLYTWPGLDGGVVNEDIAQTGTDSALLVNGYNPPSCMYSRCYAAAYRAWAQWFPDGNITIPTFGVAAGDQVSAQVYIGDSDGNLAVNGCCMWFQINNLTQHTLGAGCEGSGSQCVAPFFSETNHHFVGDTAEWIIERTNSIGPNILPKYGTLSMTNVGAFTVNYTRHGFGSDPFLNITMVNVQNPNDPTYHALSQVAPVDGTNNLTFTWDAYK